jgi:nucleoid-associated protein YgaU
MAQAPAAPAAPAAKPAAPPVVTVTPGLTPKAAPPVVQGSRMPGGSTTATPAKSNGKTDPKPRMASANGGDWYIVKADDTLSGIAKRFYGKGNLYRRIIAANRSKIDDPDLIYQGMKLRIPSA